MRDNIEFLYLEGPQYRCNQKDGLPRVGNLVIRAEQAARKLVKVG